MTTTNTRKIIRKRRKFRKEFIEFMNTILIIGIFIVFGFGIFKFMYTIVSYPEECFTTEKYHFMISINNGDEEAINRYKEEYISRDKYLFNGPVTVELCCEKYDLDVTETKIAFAESDYDSFQKFFNKEIKNKRHE